MEELSYPNTTVNAKRTFGIEEDIEIPAFEVANEYVPVIDNSYYFDSLTTKSIIAGFKHNRRTFIQGYHGSGKSSHIEQVAARLNWPCIRLNLDSQISRMDLIGKDIITINNGKQITEFQEGILSWAIQRPIALVFDEYDAGRPDVMFVIQRVLEAEGSLVLPDQNRIIHPHRFFRLFATANTIGLGDYTGMYQGTQMINQAQLDRWNIVCSLNYLPPEEEFKILKAKLGDKFQDRHLKMMISLANIIRRGFMAGEILSVMSPRALIAWAENSIIFRDVPFAFIVSFLNKCSDDDKKTVAGYYKECTNESLPNY